MKTDKFLTDEESTHLETILKARLQSDVRNCLLLLLSLKTGARASEVLFLRKRDVNVFNATVSFIGLKNGNDRQIPIEHGIFKILAGYVAEMEDDEKIFPISYIRFSQIWAEYRPVKKKLHSLRHTVGVKVYKKSRSVHLVKTVLGHKSIQSSMVYLDFVESQAEMKKALT